LPRFALEIRETIHERVNAPQMWDAPGYFQSLANLGFELQMPGVVPAGEGTLRVKTGITRATGGYNRIDCLKAELDRTPHQNAR
jgi:hypothetical protein